MSRIWTSCAPDDLTVDNGLEALKTRGRDLQLLQSVPPQVSTMAAPTAHNRASGPLIVIAAIVLLLVSSGLATASGPDGRIRGILTDSVSGALIAGASVRIEASDLPWVFQATSDASGYFEFAVPPHRYSLSASSPAHLRNVTSVAVGSGQVVWANMTLSPASSRSARIQGYVTDSVSASPVTVGRIVARPWVGSFWNYENASALNASGYFAMDLVPSSYDIATDGVIGYAPYDYYPVYIGAGEVLWYNLSLDPNPVDAWINGTVYDDATSIPIAGAQITARVDGLLILPSVTADASGVYSLPVPSGSVELAADAIGYAPASTSVYVWGAGQYYQDMRLVPLAQSIRGYVRDGVTGEPMADVPVTIDPLFFDGYYDQATTDASGYYEVAVPDDYYVAAARAPGYTSWSTWILFFYGPIAWANATLWPIVSTISGYLTDAVDGSPVPGLLVRAIDLRTNYISSTTADGSGFFTLSVPPSPAMSVWVFGQGPYAGNVAYVGTTPYATTWVNITVDRLAAQILVNVTDALSGSPLSGVSVTAAWYYGSDYGATDANGSTILGAPVSVDVYVTVFASGYDYWTGVLTPVDGENTLSVALFPDLPQDVRIRGYVTDASSGLGIWSATVEATGTGMYPPYDYTDSTGFYELTTVAAPQTIRATEADYTAGEASVTPTSGEVLWVNFTLTPDANAPRILSFTATPSSGLDESNPTALRADVNETSLERADLSILMLYTSSAGVGTFLNLGTLDPAGVAVTMPSNGSYAVSASWDTRTEVGRLSDGRTSAWWPFLRYGGPFLAIVSGYFDNATLSSPIPGNAVFDSRDGRFLFMLTGSEFIGPQEQPAATFAPFAVGWRIDLTTAAIVDYRIVTGPALSLGTMNLVASPSVPSGTYAGLLQVSDTAGGYDQAAVLMRTARDTVPPVANAGADRTVDEDAVVTFDGGASTDNVGIASYTWTFVDGSPQTLTGASSTYVFATPGVYVVTLTVQDADGNVGTDTITVTVRDVTAPVVSVASPSEGATVSAPVAVTVNATDNVGVVRVELLVDGTSVGSDTTDPFGFVLAAGSLGLGNHTLEIVAYDAAGNAASEVRHVTIVASSGGAPLGSDFILLLGLILLPILAAIAVFLILMRRRRPQQPMATAARVQNAPGAPERPVETGPTIEPAELEDSEPLESDSEIV